MLHVLKASLIALASAAMFVSSTWAGPTPPMLRSGHSLAEPVRSGSGYFPQEAIADWNGERFNIQPLSWMNRFDAHRAMIENWISVYPDQVAALQDAIRSNRALAAALQARNVQIRNIGAAQQAFSGNLIFYLQ